MQLKAKIVLSKNNSWLLSALATNTASSRGRQESFPSSYVGPQDCQMDHPKPGRPKYQTDILNCDLRRVSIVHVVSLSENCSRGWSPEMDLREWRRRQKVMWDKTGKGKNPRVSKIQTWPPETGKVAAQRSVSKRRCEFETSTGLSHPVKCGKDWFLEDVHCHIPRHRLQLPDIPVSPNTARYKPIST